MAENREGDRIETPACPQCNTPACMSVVSRTEFVIYFRCSQCGHVQSVRKPNWNVET